MEAAKPKPARHASPRPECPQLVASLADKPVARFRHLVPGPGEVDNRFRDDNPCLVGHLLQAWTFRVHLPHRAHLGAVVERARTPLARVPERPHALPISRRDRHLEGVLDAVAAPCLLHQTGHPLDGSSSRPSVSARKNSNSESVDPSMDVYNDSSTASASSRLTREKSRTRPLWTQSHRP